MVCENKVLFPDDAGECVFSWRSREGSLTKSQPVRCKCWCLLPTRQKRGGELGSAGSETAELKRGCSFQCSGWDWHRSHRTEINGGLWCWVWEQQPSRVLCWALAPPDGMGAGKSADSLAVPIAGQHQREPWSWEKRKEAPSAQAGTSRAWPALCWVMEIDSELVLPERWNTSRKPLGSHSEAGWFWHTATLTILVFFSSAEFDHLL